MTHLLTDLLTIKVVDPPENLDFHGAGDEDPDAASCIRCGSVISSADLRALESYIPNGAFVPTPVRIDGCVLITPKGALYCAGCAPGVQICEGCGCTDEAGCVAGCWWEDDDLCSRCMGPQVRPSEIGTYELGNGDT